MSNHFIEAEVLSYLVGLLQADGHHWQGAGFKGKITLELKASDRLLLDRLVEILPVYSSVRERTRNTNFKDGYRSVVWSVYDLALRDHLASLGVLSGPKAETFSPSFAQSTNRDYFRGLVDGDGSLGYTGEGFPFLSFVTKSESMARAYEAFLRTVTGKLKHTNPNTRDKVYNICVYKEDAQKVASRLYADATLSLPRKQEAHMGIMGWVRPPTMRKVEGRRKWNHQEDACVLHNSTLEASKLLDRSVKSVQARKNRLNKQRQ